MSVRRRTRRAGATRRASATRPENVAVHYPEDLPSFIAETDWRVYRAVIEQARARGVSFAVSGGFASSFYTGLWRNTKDIDLCVLPQAREDMVQATRDAGLDDLYDEKSYDRNWIYRATREGVIVDVIWQLANYQGAVDEAWLTLGPEVRLYEETIRLVPPEEMIWSKIHIVQRDRCDWPDVVNLLYAAGPALDWERLIARLHGEERLLGSVVLFFAWLAPGRARMLPEWIWERLGIERPRAGPQRDDERIRRIDSRTWFSPLEA